MSGAALAKSGVDLFSSTVPPDFLNFGYGTSFQPKKVQEVLALKKQDVSRIASISEQSVRYDEHIPREMLDRFEEIASTMNMVARQFDGDVQKTVMWFKARNPLLGDVSPRDMIRLGKYERLRRHIINAMMSNI
jgi:hypothetical protein